MKEEKRLAVQHFFGLLLIGTPTSIALVSGFALTGRALGPDMSAVAILLLMVGAAGILATQSYIILNGILHSATDSDKSSIRFFDRLRGTLFIVSILAIEVVFGAVLILVIGAPSMWLWLLGFMIFGWPFAMAYTIRRIQWPGTWKRVWTDSIISIPTVLVFMTLVLAFPVCVLFGRG